MKTSSIILFILIIANYFNISTASNVDPETINKEVVSGFRTGNAKQIAKYFNSIIDLTIPGEEGNFSKAQAEFIIKDFFKKNTPSSFVINHQGSSNIGSQYSIGTLKTSNKTFRIYFLIKKISNKYCIEQLKIESD